LTEAVWGLGIAGLEIAKKNVFSHSSCWGVDWGSLGLGHCAPRNGKVKCI
jgi:hypothetical protein